MVTRSIIKKVPIQLSIKQPRDFLNLIWDGKDSILWSLNFHPARKKLLLDLIDTLTTNEDGLTAAIAISNAIVVRGCSDEALDHYLPLMENPKKDWAHCVTHTIGDALRERKNLTQLQQAKLMNLVEQAVLVDETHYEICTDFSNYKTLYPSIKPRLLNLANTYINTQKQYMVRDAIEVKLNLEGSTNESIAFCLSRLQDLPLSCVYIPLTIMLSHGKNLSSTVSKQVIELATKFLRDESGDVDYFKENIIYLLELFSQEQSCNNTNEAQINGNYVLNNTGVQPEQEAVIIANRIESQANQEITTLEWIISYGTSTPVLIFYFLLLIWL